MVLTEEYKQSAVARLHVGDCSCVIGNGGALTVCHERGVKDLYRLLKESPDVLSGAFVADKIVGKGAAALMVLGGVAEVYTDVISRPAIELFVKEGVRVAYGECVPNIINRAGDGICPVETLCEPCGSAAECLPLIENFIAINKPK